jgi:uncharacterized membrane protein
MGVTTSEVGYTSATTERGDHKVRKGHVVAKKKKCTTSNCIWTAQTIIIIIITISFMQGIYTYIPETNHVPKQYNVTAILSLLFMVPISLVPVLTL